MANITIVSTTNSINVNFGDYGGVELQSLEGCWRKEIISFEKRSDYVIARVRGEKDWLVSYNGVDGTFQIDSIDTVAPTTNDDLYTKLIALI